MQEHIPTVKWVRHPLDNNPSRWIDISNLDALWSRDAHYIGPHGCPDDQPGKYVCIGEQMAERQPFNMPRIYMKDGRVRFTDGRARFAWLRDHGADAIPVTVPPSDVDRMEAQFGSDLRVTTFRLLGM